MSAIDATSMIQQFPRDKRLLDPFCGSGTIVYEAQRWGLDTIGVDNNPLAVIIAKGKTQPLNRKEMLEDLKNLIKEAAELGNPDEMPDFARQYFHPRTANHIMSIQHFYEDLTDYQKAAYFGSIALAARACNHYKWSSNSIGKIIKPHREIDFFDVLSKKARKHSSSIEHVARCRIFQHDARELSKIIDKNSIDIVYTSPPYFDSLDYTSYYGRIVYSIIGEDRAEIRDGLTQKFSSYEEDMRKAMKEIDIVTTDTALVVFVVGDKKTKDGVINGGEFFTDLTDWKPTYIVEREYTGSSSQIWDSINRTIRKEQIVVWDKSRL